MHHFHHASHPTRRRGRGTWPWRMEDVWRYIHVQAGQIPNQDVQQNLAVGVTKIPIRSVRHTRRRRGHERARHTAAQSQAERGRGAAYGPCHSAMWRRDQ